MEVPHQNLNIGQTEPKISEAEHAPNQRKKLDLEKPANRHRNILDTEIKYEESQISKAKLENLTSSRVDSELTPKTVKQHPRPDLRHIDVFPKTVTSNISSREDDRTYRLNRNVMESVLGDSFRGVPLEVFSWGTICSASGTPERCASILKQKLTFCVEIEKWKRAPKELFAHFARLVAIITEFYRPVRWRDRRGNTQHDFTCIAAEHSRATAG